MKRFCTICTGPINAQQHVMRMTPYMHDNNTQCIQFLVKEIANLKNDLSKHKRNGLHFQDEEY